MEALVLALSSDGNADALAWLLQRQATTAHSVNTTNQQLREVVKPFSQPSHARAGLLEWVRERTQHLRQPPPPPVPQPEQEVRA